MQDDWDASPAELMVACNNLTNCAGFNTDGWLKSSVTPTVAAACDLYVKQTVCDYLDFCIVSRDK